MSMFGDSQPAMNELYELLSRRQDEIGAVRTLQEALTVVQTFSEFALSDIKEET